ncbi:MAG TPA: flagellar basal body-associated FliL family protein [Bacillota bacterium]|jgi:flagellar FliL protein
MRRQPTKPWISLDKGAISLVTLVLAVVIVAGVVGGGVFILLGRNKPATEKPVEGKNYNAGEFLTNLADPSGKRLVQVTLEIEVTGDKAVQELTKKAVPVHDAILGVLRSKTSADLQGQTGMAALATDLGKAVEALLTQGKVMKVYFLQFMIQ